MNDKVKLFFHMENGLKTLNKLRTVMEGVDYDSLDCDLFRYDEHLTLLVRLDMAFEFLDIIYNCDNYDINEEYCEDATFWLNYMKENTITPAGAEMVNMNREFKTGKHQIAMPKDLDLVPKLMTKLKQFQEYRLPTDYDHILRFQDCDAAYVPAPFVIQWAEVAMNRIQQKIEVS